MANGDLRVMEGILETSHEAMEVAGEAIEMLMAGHGTIAIANQATSRIHRALGEASDGPSDHMERVAALLARTKPHGGFA